MTSFVEAVLENDADVLESDVYEAIEAAFEEWEPAAGNLEVWLTKAFTRIASTVREQAAVMSKEAFKKFGETIANVPPILAAPASGTSTWTMVDNAGYTIPAGTLVSLEATGDEVVGFETVGAVVVEPGSTTTGAGEVVLQAVIAGEEANGLEGAPSLIDPLAYVDSIALVAPTSGGVDEEDEDDYLNRLTEALQLLSLSLIVQRDFEIDARGVAGVARALAIPGYDAEEETEENPLMVTVVPVDEDGLALSAPVKEELQARQQAKVPAETVVHVADPTYTKIDVTTQVAVLSGFDPEVVKEAVKSRLTEYLSPALWGLPQAGDEAASTGWVNRDTVYRFELISEADRVTGVDRVVSLTLAKDGSELGTADVALAGVAPLAKPDTITVTTA